MPAYGLFVGGSLILIGCLIVLARLTQRELDPDPRGGAHLSDRILSVRDLYINVVISQVIIVGLLIAIAWWTSIPIGAFGIGGYGHVLVGTGIGLGILLFLLNEASGMMLDRLGISYSEDLRRALAPTNGVEWGILLFVVLPIIAIAEEFIFRATLIGALEAGFGISPILLVLFSSFAFALGHGLQGPGGILVTGILGILLGIAFVVSGSLLLVVVAHYVVNMLEFGIHEGIRA